MTKAEYIERIRIKLSRIVKPENKTVFHPEFLASIIESAMNRIAYAQWTPQTDRELDNYTKTYKNVDVNYDPDLEKYYSNLPEKIINLPNNKGIRVISPMKSQESYFVPENQLSSNVFANLPSGRVGNRIPYYVEGSKVFYRWFKSDIKKVLMKLVVPFTRLEDSDNVYAMGNSDEMIYQIVLNYIDETQLEDKANDDRRWIPQG